MSTRIDRLIDCHPRWISGQPDDVARGVSFDCPEGHASCYHAIPFTPDMDGTPCAGWQTNGEVWQRKGDTFETLTLSPSIKRYPTYMNREVAIASGVFPEHLNDSHFCAFHGYIRDGRIEFCGDSR